MKTYEFECNNRDNGGECHGGTFVIPGDFPSPPIRSECTKCNGTGKMLVKREFIEKIITENEKDILELEADIENIKDLNLLYRKQLDDNS